jgi:hypothetical protein
MQPYKPLLKFFVFKTVIFLTFWQVGRWVGKGVNECVEQTGVTSHAAPIGKL